MTEPQVVRRPARFARQTMTKKIISLSKELEDARMQLVACSVVAGANTRESAANVRPIHPDYMCPAVEDVIRATDREIELREQLAKEWQLHDETKRQLANREKQIVILRDALALAIEHYVPTSQEQEFVEALNATQIKEDTK